MKATPTETKPYRRRGVIYYVRSRSRASGVSVINPRLTCTSSEVVGQGRSVSEDVMSNANSFFVTATGPGTSWLMDKAGFCSWVGQEWCNDTGQKIHQALGRGWLDRVHPDDKAAVMQRLDLAQAEQVLSFQCRIIHADGDVRWCRSRAVIVLSTCGATEMWAGFSTDIHDLMSLQAKQEILVSELQHRLRNIIAVVRSMAALTLESGPARDDYDARLLAISRTQALLSGATRSLGLADLVDAELAVYVHKYHDRITIDGPAVEIPETQMLPLALALHELATNAVKYGALSQLEGRLSVCWHVTDLEDGSRHLSLHWQESGVRMPAGPVPRRGYGRELIESALPYQLNAKTSLDFTSDGVCCVVVIALANVPT